MANTILTMTAITRKALQLFRNANSFIKNIDRQYDSSYAKSGAKIGSTLSIRKPNDYTVRSGATAVPQNTIEAVVNLTVNNQLGVDTSFSSAELTLSMDDFSERILEPMVNNLAGSVASAIMQQAEGINNLVHNTSGAATANPTINTWLAAGAVLDVNLAPRGDRTAIVDPMTMSRTVSTLSGLFNSQEKVGQQFKKALIGQDTLGMDWAMDQTVLLHTAGTFASGTVNGANQTGSTLTVNAITGTLVAGDIITIAGVQGVNRVTKQSTGSLQQFVVTANVSNGATSIPIYPAIVPAVGGNAVAYQTVGASPANSAAIAPVIAAGETYRKNFVFVPAAVTMVTADLDLPSGAVVSAAREAFDGLSIRMIRDYNSTTDVWLTRLDLLFGAAFLRPEWCCIVADSL